MLKIAITGQMKSGKTLISKLLAKKLSCSLISFDEVVNNIIIKNNFRDIFGYSINISDLKSKKQFISQIIFSDEQKKKNYENFIWSKCEDFLKELSKRTEKYLVLEIPLLFQSKLEKYIDKIIFVSSDLDHRRQRFLSSNTIADNSEESFNAREKIISQYLKDNKFYINSKVDFFIENNSSIEELENKIVGIVREIRKDTTVSN